MTARRLASLYWALSVLISITTSCSKPEEEQADFDASRVDSGIATSSDLKTDNACQLLTRSEAAGVLASSIKKVGDEGAPQPIGTMLRSSCFYRGEDGGTVQLTVNSFQTPEDAAQRYGQLKGRYRGARAVPNLGDDAVAENQTLIVKSGSRYLTVDLNPSGSKKITDYADAKQMEPVIAAERQVALTAIGRLPAGAAVATTTGSAGSGRSVCSMITKEEMAQVLGGPLTHAVPADSPDKTACTYTGADGRFAQVTVEWAGGETGMAGARMAGALMAQSGGGVKATTPVDGVGDEAVFVVGGILNVRKGLALITVDLRGQEDNEAKATAIAQKVIAKL